MPCFLDHYKELNFDMVGVSDIWSKRREEAQRLWKEKLGAPRGRLPQQRRAVRQQERGRGVHRHRRFSRTRCTPSRRCGPALRCLRGEAFCRDDG
ncbi:MAG: hypothetical protein WKG07_05460 [Hymenobacter sp.]